MPQKPPDLDESGSPITSSISNRVATKTAKPPDLNDKDELIESPKKGLIDRGFDFAKGILANPKVREIGERFLTGTSPELEQSRKEHGIGPVIGTPESESSILPEWKSQPETFARGFTKSIYSDFIRPLGTPSGVLGMSQPGEIPPIREVPANRTLGPGPRFYANEGGDVLDINKGQSLRRSTEISYKAPESLDTTDKGLVEGFKTNARNKARQERFNPIEISKDTSKIETPVELSKAKTPKIVTPTAKFRGWQEGLAEDGSEDIPLYNVKGGEYDGSTVGVDRLKEIGAEVPETPPNDLRLNKETATSESKIPLYRWQSEKGAGVPDWVKDNPKYQESQKASGGWYTNNLDNIEFYKQDAEGNGKLITKYVTPQEFEASKVSNHPDALKFSADPKTEHFFSNSKPPDLPASFKADEVPSELPANHISVYGPDGVADQLDRLDTSIDTAIMRSRINESDGIAVQNVIDGIENSLGKRKSIPKEEYDVLSEKLRSAQENFINKKREFKAIKGGKLEETIPEIIKGPTIEEPKKYTIENAPPNQRARIMRGRNDPIDVLFTDSNSRDLFGAGQSLFKNGEIKPGIVDRLKFATSRVMSKYGLNEQEARKAITGYNNHIRNLSKAQPKYGENLSIEAPSFEEFIKPKDIPPNLQGDTELHGVEKSPTIAKKATTKLQDIEDAAVKRIKDRGTFKGGRISSGLPVDDLADFATIGAAKIGKGLVKFADWSAEMVRHFGEEIRPHLEVIFKAAQSKYKALEMSGNARTVGGAGGGSKATPLQVETASALKKLLNSVIGSKGLREMQEKAYTTERAKRFAAFDSVKQAGEAGARTKLGKLSGELPKFNIETLHLEQGERDALFDTISSSKLSNGEKATGYRALHKLLEGGHVPQRGELEVLDTVFGKGMGMVGGPGHASEYEILNNILEEANGLPNSRLTKPPSKTRQAYELTRGLMSVDIPYMTSAAFRQGVGLAGTKRWFQAISEQAKVFGNEAIYNKIMNDINNNPIHTRRMVFDPEKGRTVLTSIADEIGLKSSDLKTLTRREEQIRSNLAERLTGYGRYIRGSNRSYTTFLNSLRTHTAEDWLKAANVIDENGMITDIDRARRIGNTINELTGAANLNVQAPFSRFTGSSKELELEKSSDALSLLLFSPRNLMRDARMMNPLNYIKTDKLERLKYLEGAVRRAGAWASYTGLAALGGATVSNNITSSDFGKPRIGDTRADAGSGLLQWIVLMGKQALGESTSSTSNRTRELGSDPIAETRLSLLESFIINRLHPTLGLGALALSATKSRPFYPISSTIEHVVPMYTNDLHELMNSNPDLRQIILSLSASALSMGNTTYGKEDFSKPRYDIPGDIKLEGGSLLDSSKRSSGRPSIRGLRLTP